MWRRCLWACCVVCSASSASAQEPTISEVRFEQEGRPLVDPALTDLIETTVGKPVSVRDVRETILHVMSLDRFDDVQVFREETGTSVRLRYVLVPRHTVDRVEFRGMLGVSEGDLRRVIADRFGDTPRASRAREVADALKAAYRDRGYPNVTVTPNVEETHDPHRATMAIAIQAGARASIVDLRILQTDGDDNGKIAGAPEIRTGQPYSKETVDAELEQWAARLRATGYYEARATHGVTFPPDGAVVSISLTLGPRVMVAFSGDPLPEKERERLVPIRTEASADEDLLEDSARAIEDYLFARGYRDAAVTYARETRNGEVRITFDVKRGPRYLVDEIVIMGNAGVPVLELRQLLRGKEGEPFVQVAFDTGVKSIENLYRTRGFSRAQVRLTVVEMAPESPTERDRRVNVTVQVAEGSRTLVRAVTFQGNMVLNETELRGFLTLTPAQPFSTEVLATDRDRIELEYRNRGYESVGVIPNATLIEDGVQVDVRFEITEGPQILVDHVIIVGNERTSRRTIERELLLRPGEPLGLSATVESRSRLVALGLFRRVDIEELRHGAELRRDVRVRVSEARPTSIGGGGGVEGGFRLRQDEGGVAVEQFELSPRGFFEIGRRNLWGKNRAVNLFTRVSLRSRDVTKDGVLVTDPAEQIGYGFNEYRVVGTFREPRVLNSSADVLVTGILEQAVRSSFNFARREMRADAGFRVSRIYSLVGRYSFERTELFDEQFKPEEQPIIDRLFPQVRLSTLSGSLIRDTRDDVVDASRGTLFIVDSDLATRGIGSEVGFVKTYIQGFGFRRVPGTRRIVVAYGARLGLAHGFPRVVATVPVPSSPDTSVSPPPIITIVQDLPASERFFAGGDTTVRGFALDRLGDESTISPSGFPTGGNGVVIFNAEWRMALLGPLQGVGFLDAGNVVAKAGDLNLAKLRTAAGFGLRYRSPVGPIRIDLGFKLDRRELSPGRLERRSIVHISMGQAF